MTEENEPDATLDPPAAAGELPLDPAREAAVRRALADAAGPEPVPAEVTAQLEETLAGLVAERATGADLVPDLSHPENPGVVVPLDAAARRRRMRVRALLGAAAAVVAVGVGVGAINGAGDGGSDAVTAADEMAADDPARSAADGDAGGGAAALEDGSQSYSADDAPESVEDQAAAPEDRAESLVEPRRVVTDEPVREVRADRLREDLVALQHVSLPRPSDADYSGSTLSAPADFVCEPARFGSGHLVGITYDGKPAVVAFREPVGSTQAAEVLACGTGDVLHSTTLTTTG